MTAIESKDTNHNGHEKESLAELRHDIQQTRTELGHTVEALAAKVDVKARAHDAVEDAKLKAKLRLHTTIDRLAVAVRRNPVPLAAGALALILAAILVPVAKKRTSR
jgi:DNA-binding XRE family transcriptional regulator